MGVEKQQYERMKLVRFEYAQVARPADQQQNKEMIQQIDSQGFRPFGVDCSFEMR